MNENDALLILNAISGIANARIRSLMQHFGSACSVLSRSQDVLLSSGILPLKIIQNVIQFPQDEFLKKERLLMRQHGVEVVTFLDQEYPAALKAIPDAPVVLYIKGRLSGKQEPAVAIVGSRRASVYGLGVAEKFSRELAELGVTVVSGMARGIDTAVHRGTLKARGRTIAVIGSGLAEIYPPENRKIFEEISSDGAVISEFSMTALPLPGHFPRRNRIISGLSLGVIVVEASERSGALITGDLALEQGREVFAVPGHIDSPNSQGVHTLIKQGAKLVHNVQDVLEELKPQLENILNIHKKAEPEVIKAPAARNRLTDPEELILQRVDDEPVHADALIGSLNLSSPAALAALSQLELKHLIKQLPGKKFVKIKNQK